MRVIRWTMVLNFGRGVRAVVKAGDPHSACRAPSLRFGNIHQRAGCKAILHRLAESPRNRRAQLAVRCAALHRRVLHPHPLPWRREWPESLLLLRACEIREAVRQGRRELELVRASAMRIIGDVPLVPCARYGRNHRGR